MFPLVSSFAPFDTILICSSIVKIVNRLEINDIASSVRLLLNVIYIHKQNCGPGFESQDVFVGILRCTCRYCTNLQSG